MSHDVYTRPYDKDNPAEVKFFAEWLFVAREKNRFNPELFRRGQVQILTCFDSSGIVGFIPVAVAYVLESLAMKPGLSPLVEGKALEAAQHHLTHCAIEKKIPYAFFVTFDETVLSFARRHGWLDVTVPMLNLDFNALEPKNENH